MENQVKANNVRIELLERQNDGLRNSITKLMTMQQPAVPQQPQWATYVTVSLICCYIPAINVLLTLRVDIKENHTNLMHFPIS